MEILKLIILQLFISVNDEKLKAIILYNRGTIKYRMGCKEDALKDLEGALQITPENDEFKEAFTKCKESK